MDLAYARHAKVVSERMRHLGRLLPQEWEGGSIPWKYHHRYFSMDDAPCWHSGVLLGHLWIRVYYHETHYVVEMGRSLLRGRKHVCAAGQEYVMSAILSTDVGALPSDSHLCAFLASALRNLHIFVDRLHTDLGRDRIRTSTIHALDALL